jgi:AbrB family looped-hinge helix DNA binding protein
MTARSAWRGTGSGCKTPEFVVRRQARATQDGATMIRHDVLPPQQVILMKVQMPTTLTSKGQVTIAKLIRDALNLEPGTRVEFSVNASGEVVLHPAPAPTGRRRSVRD